MKLCFNTSAYGNHDLEHALRQIASLGYWGAEIQVERPHGFPGDLDPPRIAEVKALLLELNLRGVGIMSANSVNFEGYTAMFEPSWINVHEEVRRGRLEITKKVIDDAAGIGCMTVQTGSGLLANAGFPLPEVAWGFLVEGLEEAADYAGKKGVILTIEAEPGTLVESTVDLARIVKDVSSAHFALTYDIGHSALLGEDLLQGIRLLHEHFANVHIEDIAGRRHLHLIPGNGDGNLNLERVVRELAVVGYDKTVTCDLYSQVADPDYAAKTSYEYLRPIFEKYVG